LLAHLGQIRQRFSFPGYGRRLGRPEDGSLELRVIPAIRQRPADTYRFGPFEVVGDRGLADGATPGDLPLPQTQLMPQSKNVFDLAHGQSPVGQTDSPFQGEAHLPVLLSSAAALSRPKSIPVKPITIPEGAKRDRFPAGTAIGFSPEC
jgi:hypothetical protein